jgi:hypothetical protein
MSRLSGEEFEGRKPSDVTSSDAAMTKLKSVSECVQFGIDG